MSHGLHTSIRLSSQDLDPIAAGACMACGGDSPRDSVACVQRAPDVHYLACDRCGACSVSAMPRAAFLKAFYESHYAAPHVDTTASYARGLGAHVARSLAGVQVADAPYSILDFGGSDGSLGVEVARSLLAAGQISRASIVVVDFVEPARVADERISISSAKQLGDLPGVFDLVMASAVLEHIPELNPTLRTLFARMAPNGYLYARTPYVLPIRRILPRFDLLFPAHVHDLGPKFWNNICRTFEFDAEVVVSQPSYVQGTLRDDPVKTILAHLLKLPAHLELHLGKLLLGKRPQPRTPRWPLVGGWEVVVRRNASTGGASVAA